MYLTPNVPLLDSSSLSSRNQLGLLLNEMGLLGEAVEVGTHRGEFAAALLAGWGGDRLHCVDPWENQPPEYEEQSETLTGAAGGNGDRARDRRAAEARLAGHINAGRCRLVMSLSVDAAPAFADGSLDLVYLDGDHRPEAVAADLEAWWPKIRPGGLLAGHDLVCPGELAGGWAGCIQPPLFTFLAARPDSLPIRVIVEEGGLPWSFYAVRR